MEFEYVGTLSYDPPIQVNNGDAVRQNYALHYDDTGELASVEVMSTELIDAMEEYGLIPEDYDYEDMPAEDYWDSEEQYLTTPYYPDVIDKGLPVLVNASDKIVLDYFHPKDSTKRASVTIEFHQETDVLTYVRTEQNHNTLTNPLVIELHIRKWK